MSVQAQISHIRLATTQGPVLRGQVPTATLGREKSTAGSTEPPPPDKDGIFLQSQRTVLVSLLSLVHSQQSRAFQKHTQPDWFLLRADRISLKPRKQDRAVAADTWRPKGRRDGHVPTSFHVETSPPTDSDSRGAQARWGPSTLESAGGYAEAG